MRTLDRFISASLGCLLFILCMTSPASALNTMVDYTSLPPVVADTVLPNVLVMISNDYTGFYAGYPDKTNYDNSVDYWGYFDPHKYYSGAAGGEFDPLGWTAIDPVTNKYDHYVPSGETNAWSGNFLNWVTMSHADFLRKALTGGRRSADTSSDGGTRLIRAYLPDSKKTYWKKRYAGSDLNRLVPATYANNQNFFYNYQDRMDIQNGDEDSLTWGSGIEVSTGICLKSMLEESCTAYNNGQFYKPEGLLQRFYDKMRFALMSYMQENSNDSGGILRTQMMTLESHFSQTNGSLNEGANSMVAFINKYHSKGWDPLGEMFYDGVRFFRGNTTGQKTYCNGGGVQSDDSFNVLGCKTNKLWEDPITNWCQKNNILIINDEYPSADDDEVPYAAFSSPSYAYRDDPVAHAGNTPYNPDLRSILDRIGDIEGLTGTTQNFGDYLGNTGTAVCTNKTLNNLSDLRGVCPTEPTSRGTFYLAALAYDALTQDMRPDTEFENDQNIRTWAIAFRGSPGNYEVPPPPLNQMWLAGKWGNFEEKNSTPGPDLPEEWMKSSKGCADPSDLTDKDCQPKGFFYADNGRDIEAAIQEAFDSILRNAASGTAVSVLANSGQGEGNLVQAYYRPAVSEGARDVKWTGYLQSLWVDKYGYIREDTDQDQALDVTKDSVLNYFDDNGTTKVEVYPVTSTEPYPTIGPGGSSFDPKELAEILTVWEGGTTLAQSDAADRNIFTSLDGSSHIDFSSTNKDSIMPYLALQDSIVADEDFGKTELVRAQNLIEYSRGNNTLLNPGVFAGSSVLTMRSRVRTLSETDSAGVTTTGDYVWKLGDIINSTPVSISAPPDRFDLIYGDKSYSDYYVKYKNRETMIYVGANDGMLHAFTSWQYDQTLDQFVAPTNLPSGSLTPASASIGAEVWAYVPQNLLPHLKWFARKDYTHVYYMDLQPRIFDARIFTPDDEHPNGWGTVLVVGMNTGGGYTTVSGDFDGDGNIDPQAREFKSSIIVMDITNPRAPDLLWERTYENLGFTQAIPTAVRIGNFTDVGTTWYDTAGSWFLIFGNGPDTGEISGVPNYKGETDDSGRLYIVDLADGTPHSKANEDWWNDVALESRAFFNSPIAYDKGLNYNVDAAYMGTTFDADSNGGSGETHDWQGSVYRLLTWSPAATPPILSGSYSADPTEWSLQKVFESPRPITAPGVVSIDHYGNTWTYFGTGRLYTITGDGSDTKSLDQEYLLGFKDPLFNISYLTAADKSQTLTTADLLDASPFAILPTNEVKCEDGATYSNPDVIPASPAADFHPCDNPSDSDPAWAFNDLLNFARTKDGWFRKLPIGDTAERSLNKPAVFGGLSFFTTFSPIGAICESGGSSNLWALYYETGTAYKRPVFRGEFAYDEIAIGTGTGNKISESYDLGSGSTSSVGIHLGKQNEKAGDGENLSGDLATGFVQQGTGQIVDFDFETALKVLSGLRSWRER